MNKMFIISAIIISIAMLSGNAVFMPVSADQVNDCTSKCKKELTICERHAKREAKKKSSAKSQCNRTFGECQAKCHPHEGPPCEEGSRGGDPCKKQRGPRGAQF